MSKLRNRLFLSYIGTFAVLIIVISLVIFAFLYKLMINEIGATRVDVLSQIGERSNTVKNSSITISNLYNLDSLLLSALCEKLDKEEEKEVKVHLDNMKKNYDVVFRDVGIAYDVIVIGENGFCYSSQAGDNYNFSSLKNQLWYKKIYERNGEITFISSFKDIFGTEKTKYVFSASRIVHDSEGKVVGTLLINIDEKYLANLYDSTLNGNNNIYIIDRKGNIISHNNKSMRGMNFIDVEKFKQLYGENEFHIIKKSQGDYLISNYYDQQTGWTIIEEMRCAAVFSKIYYAVYIIFFVMGVCLVIALFVSYYISERVSRPVLNLCCSMEQVKKGNFDVISNVGGYDEINQLKDSFNSMAQEIKKLLEDIKRNEYYKRQTELDFLRAQINPHFLYNTLFSIKCLIELEKNEQVSYMISAFIELLKMTLRKDTDFISLEEEFLTTEKYLILQQFRYGDMISFEFELDEKTKNCKVPALILQPLVENAIFHGIEAKNDMGIVVISSNIKDNLLMISVVDDGIGMNDETIESILEKCNDKEYKRSEFIGIANVSKRIKINYGEEYGIHITSEVGIGTTISVELPVIMDKQS